MAETATRQRRKLTERLGLEPDAIPTGGNWYPEEGVLGLLVDLIETERLQECVCCGGGLAVPVIARALEQAGAGRLSVLENDPQVLDIAAEMLEAVGAAGRVRLIEAELSDYDKHQMWYNPHAVACLPQRIDLLFVDGPPHFCGRAPRWPAGPELFPRLGPAGIVVLDDAKRAKERKALQRWEADWPDLGRSDGRGGAAVLRRAG